MPKRIEPKEGPKCNGIKDGARSLNCKWGEHPLGTIVYCYRCKAKMGCVYCCEIASDLICLVCNNWASKAGVARHGDVVPNSKVRHVRTDDGWRNWEDGQADPLKRVAAITRDLKDRVTIK